MTDISDPQMGELNLQPAKVWAGEFGNAYTARNRVNWRLRVPFWRGVMPEDVRSVLEVGCNAGWNLTAIRYSMPHIGLHGVDLNRVAQRQARIAGFNVDQIDAKALAPVEEFDMVATVGVLIHIPPAELARTMLSIVQASRRYVLAVEYHADEETEIEYQGQKGLLWKRPYGRLYQDIGLVIRWRGELTKEDGFDNCTAYLMEKP